MKKLLFLISFSALAFVGYSQSTSTYPGTTLFGTSSNSDRTYRSLQLGQATIVNTTVSNTPDTISLVPGFVSGAGAVFNKDYYVTISDTVVMAIRDVGSSYTGSEMTFIFNSANANCLIKFLGFSLLSTSQWQLAAGATTVLLTQNHPLIMKFRCTGSKWAESYRSQD